MDTLEWVVEEALCDELAHALVMIYGRHAWNPEARARLRAMARTKPELLGQFEDMDALHARHPFADPGPPAMAYELQMLYGHHAVAGSMHVLRQLRRFADPPIQALFDRIDSTEAGGR